MHERYKIREARFFLARMEESVEDHEAFRYYLSAFLTAARSVLQYACEEARNAGGQAWYDAIVARSAVLEFFKDKRDVNIHGEPVNPSRDISITPGAAFIVTASLSPVVVITGEESGAAAQPTQKPEPPRKEQTKPPENSCRTTIRYRFNDWTGPEDIFELSLRYVDELERLVQEGTERRYLSVWGVARCPPVASARLWYNPGVSGTFSDTVFRRARAGRVLHFK